MSSFFLRSSISALFLSISDIKLFMRNFYDEVVISFGDWDSCMLRLFMNWLLSILFTSPSVSLWLICSFSFWRRSSSRMSWLCCCCTRLFILNSVPVVGLAFCSSLFSRAFWKSHCYYSSMSFSMLILSSKRSSSSFLGATILLERLYHDKISALPLV